ncbi:MAG: type IV pilus modification protein PilV [Cellvibrionaceae bacterium]
MKNKSSKLITQAGSGLIEVMVALLILAIGLLGILSLQANGLNSNQRALFVTEAQVLAQDMADRILSFGSVAANGYDGADGANDGVTYGGIDIQKVATVTIADNCSAGCDAAGTKAFDTLEWQQALSNSSLPRGRATVAWESPIYTIRVFWDQDREGATSIECNARRDNCFELELRI